MELAVSARLSSLDFRLLWTGTKEELRPPNMKVLVLNWFQQSKGLPL